MDVTQNTLKHSQTRIRRYKINGSMSTEKGQGGPWPFEIFLLVLGRISSYNARHQYQTGRNITPRFGRNKYILIIKEA